MDKSSSVESSRTGPDSSIAPSPYATPTVSQTDPEPRARLPISTTPREISGTESNSEYGTPRDSMSVCSLDYKSLPGDEIPRVTSVSRRAADHHHPPGHENNSGGNRVVEIEPDTRSMGSMDGGGSISSKSYEYDTADTISSSSTPVPNFVRSASGSSSISDAARELKMQGVKKGSEKAIARALSGIAAEVLKGDGHRTPLEDEKWKHKGKHFFIFSSAGKPIYSRYGDEGALAGLMAVIQAMLSVIKSRGDTARAITAGKSHVVFCSRGPLVLVGVSQVWEPTHWVERQLEFLYNQVLSLATGALLHVFERNPSQDVRHLLKGSGNLMSGLLRGFSRDPGYLIEAHCPLRMLGEVRRQATEALQDAVSHCHAKCGLLMCAGKVVSLIQDPWRPLHIHDMLLLENFVLSNDLYRKQGAEFNAPICMPHLHQTAFLHAYIYYMETDPGIFVVLLMTQADGFHLASRARMQMEQRLRNEGVIHGLKGQQMSRPVKGQIQLEELPLAAGGGKQQSSPIVYFCYKMNSKICPQYVASQPIPLIDGEKSWKELVRCIARVHTLMFEGKQTSTPAHEIQWWQDCKYGILAKATQDYSIYLVCDVVAQKDLAVKLAKELTRYIQSDQMKAELFILQKMVP